ncbi:hypothetical protein GCM10010123_25780 [Pilimelia anulata]|uniref:Uncharacterized protein n=1 Tax=Pilimelia anulata TaxID=53371 RepID=A0A8J3FB33_9ACTN|nr:hypothetical protein [Pilimelia anulata]GGJ94795.1 hypothetical protein GCM10010123_25780 [Pilimelia anulata]
MSGAVYLSRSVIAMVVTDLDRHRSPRGGTRCPVCRTPAPCARAAAAQRLLNTYARLSDRAGTEVTDRTLRCPDPVAPLRTRAMRRYLDNPDTLDTIKVVRSDGS